VSDFRVVADGFKFPEGPAVDSQGRLYCVDCDTGDIWRMTDDGKELFVNTGGIPAAIAFNSFDEMFVTDAGLQCILKITPNAEVSRYCNQADGEPLLGPNDLCFASDGTLYFTDPSGSSLDNPIGRVVRCDGVGRAKVIARGFPFPNGIALDSEQRLHFAVTWTREIRTLDGLYAQMEGDRGPDGMAFDAKGYLYAAHFGKGVVAVISPMGQVVDELDAGGMNPTNCCFRDSTLYVTEAEHGRLIAIERDMPGLALSRP